MTDNYDVLVIGSGPGGYVAAIRAAQHGLRAAVIERDRLGGICLNWGCIPTKALLHGADVAHTLANLRPLGFSTSGVEFDMAQLVEFSRGVSGRLSDGIGYLMKKNGIDVISGTARLTGRVWWVFGRTVTRRRRSPSTGPTTSSSPRVRVPVRCQG